MFYVSRTDYNTYKSGGNIGFFRDSSEKLVAIAQNIVEYKEDIPIEGWNTYKKCFYNSKKLGLNHQQKQRFIRDLFILHEFFYRGIKEGQDKREIEILYNEVFSELKRMFNN